MKLAAVDAAPDHARQSPLVESLALLLTRADLACELRVSTKTIDRMDERGKLPRPVRIGACRRWPRATILQWIASGCPDRRTFEAGRTK